MKRWLAYLPALDLRRDRAKIFGLLLVLIGINVLLYLGVNLPRNRELARLHRSIDAIEAQVGGWRQVVEEQAETLARVESTRSHMTEFFDVRLSSKLAKMTSIQREIRRIAKRFKIDPESVQYHHEALDDHALVRFEMTVPLVGSYSSLRQFLSRVETSQHFLIIDRIGLTGSKEGGARLSLNITLVTYFSTVETAPAADENAAVSGADRDDPAGEDAA